MNKKLLTAAIAAALITPLAAQADEGPTVYGVAHASVESWDVDGGADNWQVRSRQSVLGIKGSEDLGNGLKAIYKMEFQIDIADNSTGATGNINSRNQYVGLAGGWGTFLLGRHDSPTKMMTISRDKFNTTIGDWNEVRASANAASPSDLRRDNAIMYISPAFNGLTVAAMVNPGETNEDDGIDDGYRGIGAKYVNGPIYIGAGWEEIETVGTNNDEQENWRIAGSYQFGDFNIGGLYEDQSDIMAGGVAQQGIDGEIWQISASYTFGNNVVKAMYQESEKDRAAGADIEEETWSIGLDHNLSKRTKVYAVYSDTEGDDNAAIGTDVDSDALGVGLVHKF
jgi:predicted porin